MLIPSSATNVGLQRFLDIFDNLEANNEQRNGLTSVGQTIRINMAPVDSAQLPRQAQHFTVTEEDILRRAGLDSSSAEHVQLYGLMKLEVLAGLRRISQAGYSDNDSEAALRAEMSTIYHNASAATRPIYDRGMAAEGDENWIIRWLLWNAMQQPNGR